ncbi:nuclear transport factor 2 family protein [Desulfovibrio psychrotolerans]|uniref:Polyketide cyclase n=1 Tax=Desulfovibrio psychrotolerans TaxID=415242 RepID=A0A7J0BV06_9BACT|nr:nuclear transport factor 2 family protein [Desulfovibrio psychrotolerans]GFM37022.1 polyketide cyclase [Desulfovibrio psychrotolerans]
MSIKLPKPVDAYFVADRGDSEAVAQCFAEDAVVKDEGHTYQGLSAIKQWKEDASQQYTYTSEPFACEDKDGRIIVTSKVTGNFPGSPVDLHYSFSVEGDKIVSLEITL